MMYCISLQCGRKSFDVSRVSNS